MIPAAQISTMLLSVARVALCLLFHPSARNTQRAGVDKFELSKVMERAKSSYGSSLSRDHLFCGQQQRRPFPSCHFVPQPRQLQGKQG